MNLLLSTLLVMAATLALTQGRRSHRDLFGFPEDRLVSRLLQQLQPAGAIARPAGRNANKPVQVDLSVSLLRLEIMEDQLAKMSVWISMTWNDPRLSWEPSNYDNLSQVVLPAHTLWLPDIRPYNAEEYKPNKESIGLVVEQKEGKSVVIYVLPATVTTNCLQFGNGSRSLECPLKMGSWAYHGGHLNITLGENAFDLSSYYSNERWEVLGNSARVRKELYECCSNPFVSAMFNIKLNPRGERNNRRPSRD